MKPRLAIDFDEHAAATYSANFPDVEVRCGKVEDQIGTLPAADVVIGGPPCQGFSLAGDGLGEFDPRNGWPAALASVTLDSTGGTGNGIDSSKPNPPRR